MHHQELDFSDGFDVLFGNRAAQAAVMVLTPGATEGGPDNRHRGADQWLFVVSGTGEAIIEGASVPLRDGTLLLIERGEAHEIRCTGDDPLRTLNLYAPPAFDAEGEPLSAGQP